MLRLDHAGLLVAAFPRHVHVSAVARDFFPIEGTRLTFRRVHDIYARFGQGDRAVLAEDYSRHGYTDANQLSAFRFIARAFDMPAPDALPEVVLLPTERLRVTPSGQVRVDLPGRGLQDVIREYYDSHRTSRVLDLPTLYRTARATTGDVDASRTWRVAPDRGQTGINDVAWTHAGSATWNDVTIDRYRLRYEGQQEIPVLHVHRRSTGTRPTVLHVNLRGKVDASDWPAVRPLLDAGADVVSLDLPGPP